MLENYPDVLKVEDIAEILRVGRNTSYNLINSQAIKSIKIGRNIRIPKIYLMDYLENNGYNKDSNTVCAPMSQEKGVKKA